MKEIYIPPTVEEYKADLLERSIPDTRITDNDFYKRMIGWVVDNRTPILYEQDHDDEYTNLSINFNWLLLRDYSDTELGDPETILSMYALHEYCHMTHWLPTRLEQITAGEYAEQFTRSEYRASNETEVLIHYRVPELRKDVFDGRKIIFDLFKEKQIEQLGSSALSLLRPLVVETNILDEWFQTDDPRDQEILDRLKYFNGNRQWAIERFNAIQKYFSDNELPQSQGLTDDAYERTISKYEPSLSQEQYEQNMIRNIRFGYAMCGLAIPDIDDFEHARALVKGLEGQHAIVQSDRSINEEGE